MANLTDKQRAFCEHYMQCWNATEAARRAGYRGDDNTLGVVGYENLRKPKIEEYIEERMDQISMSTNEVLKRLTDWGRGSLEHFITNDDYAEALSVNTEEAQNHLGLIKKVKQNERVVKSEGDEDETVVSRRFEIEIHDPKDAVDKIARIRGMYNDKLDVAHSGDISFKIQDVDAEGNPITSS